MADVDPLQRPRLRRFPRQIVLECGRSETGDTELPNGPRDDAPSQDPPIRQRAELIRMPPSADPTDDFCNATTSRQWR